MLQYNIMNFSLGVYRRCVLKFVQDLTVMTDKAK
jgi:hypothetical protein